MANYYPNDGGTYGFIDHFLMQTTAVNTNTTVSVSIDGGPLTPMTYQGIINEMVPGDTVVRNWYTWQVAIPALTVPGRHTFQFFYHDYVWQDKDQYWADFNGYSTVKSFTIALPQPTPSQSTPNSPNPYTAPSSQTSPSETSVKPILANGRPSHDSNRGSHNKHRRSCSLAQKTHALNENLTDKQKNFFHDPLCSKFCFSTHGFSLNWF